ncbi:hypothetical protein [Massilia scottii]|uniref:hypothetical protein n=1 Tax=Massilia scottii TaxID=3057166 RepID=UPI002796891D|nr:hypothetical protein [Massilia sp. CCM 9029]MDQ1835185.1 hypothetical protein [Massilia sp. CCM 9029]
MKSIVFVLAMISVVGCNPSKPDGLVPISGPSVAKEYTPVDVLKKHDDQAEAKKPTAPQAEPVAKSGGLVPIAGPSKLKKYEAVNVLPKNSYDNATEKAKANASEPALVTK